MTIQETPYLDFDDICIRPQRSLLGSRAEAKLIRQFVTLNSKKTIEGVPIISANMDSVSTFSIAQILKEYQIFCALHKFYSEEELIGFFNTDNSSHSFYTTGVTEKDIQKLKNVAKYAKLPLICVDIANGYTEFFVKRVSEIRQLFPESVIMGGNVCTSEMVQELFIVGGLDICKIGIGPGQNCLTRKITGVGLPQFSSIVDCSKVAHSLRGHICGDGGITCGGDLCKAFGGGSDFVMIGTLLCGHEENDGTEWIYGPEVIQESIYDVPRYTGKQIKKAQKVYGMSSKEAADKFYNGMKDYKASEGSCQYIPYKGPIKNTILELLGGLRSAMTYVGADSLKNFSKCCDFIKKYK